MKKLSYILFLFTLCFAPLAFGTTEDWSIAVVELLICCSTILFLFAVKKEKKNLLFVPGLKPMAILLLFMAVQIVPLPVFLVKFISPSIYEVYKPVIELTGAQFIPLTVNMKGTVNELLRIGSYTLFFFLTVQLLRNDEKLQLTVKVVAWLAIGVAFLMILQKLTSPNEIYWYRPALENVAVTGPWVARSQYCGFMEMLVPIILALFFYYRPMVHYEESWRMKFVSFFTMPGSHMHIILGVGLILAVVSVFLSLSRGGMISLCGAIAMFFVLQSQAGKSKRSVSIAAFIVGCVLMGVGWFGWQPILSRFGNIFSVTGELQEGRLELWQNTISLIGDFFVTGSGFGTYLHIFPSYKTILSDKIFHHAHNDYLELLSDGGVIGFILVVWFVFTIFRTGWRMVQKRRDLYSVFVTIGAICGLIGMLIHSITDFNMYNGADGLYFFFLCGLVVSAGHTRSHYRSRSTLLNSMGSSANRLLFAGALLLLAGTLTIQTGQAVGRNQYALIKKININSQTGSKNLKIAEETAAKAARWDRLYGLYPALQGAVKFYQHNYKQSYEYFLQAAELNPLKGSFLQQIGLLLETRDKQLGRTFIELGYQRELLKENYVLAFAEHYLVTGQRQKAIEVLRKRTATNLDLLKTIAPVLGRNSFTREEIGRILPPSTRAWIVFGLFVKDRFNNLVEAEYYLRNALKFLRENEKINPNYFTNLYKLYIKQKKEGKAVEIIRKGIQYLPDHIPFHLRLGDHYLQKKIYYRAEEEYNQILLLQPDNQHAAKRLRELKKKMLE